MEGKYNTAPSFSSDNSKGTFIQNPSAPPNPPNAMDQISKIGFWAAVAGAVQSSLVALVLAFVLIFKYFEGGIHWKGNGLFNCHALFMITGMVVFFGNALLIYRVLAVLPKMLLKIVHGALLLSAFVFVLVALVAIFKFKRLAPNYVDMYSLHSWVGMTTCALFFLQYVIGFTIFFPPGMPINVRAIILPIHRFFGLSIFMMALASILTGMSEKLFWTNAYQSGSSTIGHIGNSFALILIFNGFLVAFLVSKDAYKRAPRPEELPYAPPRPPIN